MATASLNTVLRRLCDDSERQVAPRMTDRQLLERFVLTHEQRAFAILVERHGNMVLGVCRRILRHEQDAEDAFQATFLVLARRAGAVQWRDCVSNWLYGVALRIARKAREATLLRQRRDREHEGGPSSPADSSELREVLDLELERLPGHYRQPLILCHLQEKSQEVAAQELGCTEGALRGRLFRAREMLRERLQARGFACQATLFPALLTQSLRPIPLPPALRELTVQASVQAMSGLASTTLAFTLAEGVISSMFMHKVKLALGATLALLVLGTGLGVLTSNLQADEKPAQAASPAQKPGAPIPDEKPETDKKDQPANPPPTFRGRIIDNVEAKKQLLLRLEDENAESTHAWNGDATILIARAPGRFAELKKGMLVTGQMAGDSKNIARLEARWPTITPILKNVQAAEGTLTFSLDADQGVSFDVNLHIAKDATIFVEQLEAGLGDLLPGKKIELELSADKKSAIFVKAHREEGEAFATISEVHADRSALTLTLTTDGGGASDHSIDVNFAVKADAVVRLAGKDVTLKDLQPGMRVFFKLGEDRRSIVRLRAAAAKAVVED